MQWAIRALYSKLPFHLAKSSFYVFVLFCISFSALIDGIWVLLSETYESPGVERSWGKNLNRMGNMRRTEMALSVENHLLRR